MIRETNERQQETIKQSKEKEGYKQRHYWHEQQPSGKDSLYLVSPYTNTHTAVLLLHILQ